MIQNAAAPPFIGAYIASSRRVWFVPVSGPRKWCTPSNAFGQLSVEGVPVTSRVWNPPSGKDPVEVADFQAAVMQNLIALHVRTHKNALPHPKGFADRGFPLKAFVKLDARMEAGDIDPWQGRLTGRYNLTVRDIVTLIEVLPGAMPAEGEIREFLDVAQKRIEPPSNWKWPDT